MNARTVSVAGRVIRQLARFVAPHHADLVRGMVAELEAIDDRAERRRFALGALAAIAHLSVRRSAGGLTAAPSRLAAMTLTPGPADGAPPMIPLTPRQLMRRVLVPFAVSLVAMTGAMLAMFGSRVAPRLGERGESMGAIIETSALALPFTMAMTVPMAIFVAVTWVFSRLGNEGRLAAARGDRHALRALLGPVLVAATTMAALMFVSNTQLLPRTNTRLAAVLSEGQTRPNDRTMSVGELRAAAQAAREDASAQGDARAAAYEVEVQKKFAMSAACIVLALAGATVALRFPRGGAWLVAGSGALVFTGYYVVLIAGETLADRQVVSPLVAMWMANGLILLLAWLLVRLATTIRSAPIVS